MTADIKVSMKLLLIANNDQRLVTYFQRKVIARMRSFAAMTSKKPVLRKDAVQLFCKNCLIGIKKPGATLARWCS